MKEKLAQYEALLLKWQKAINLVSGKSLEDIEKRHFDDSLQLESLIPVGAKTLMDIGSGAGFPGMVLAMARPDLMVHLVESDARKCEFLRAVSRETNTPVEIHNVRIEKLREEPDPSTSLADARSAQDDKIDVITARALAELEVLCGYCLPFAQENPALEMLFLKGEKAAGEIEKARQRYAFDCEEFPSRTGAGGMILRLRNLHKS